MKWILSLFLISAYANVEVILTDIEGTTTSISFVHDVLFPYAKEHVQSYVVEHQYDPAVVQIIQEVKEAAGTPDANLDQVVQTLVMWMNQDKKLTPLKTLQGMMWKAGYENGEFQGHVYEDAFELMTQWKNEGLKLYVFSSGSVAAQKLIFGYSTYGDLTPLFTNYFDTKVGGKKEASSYVKIAAQIGLAPEKILFLSDTLEELVAAREAGMQTIMLVREGASVDHPFEAVSTFREIRLK